MPAQADGIDALCRALFWHAACGVHPARAFALAFAPRRGRAARGAAHALAGGRHRRRHYRIDVCARRRRNPADAEAGHAWSVVGAHPHRFRQVRVRTVHAVRPDGRRADRLRRGTRNGALAAAGVGHAPAVPVLCRAGPGAHGRCAQVGRRARPAVRRRRGQCVQLPAFRRAARPMPVFRPGMPTRRSRWRLRCPRCGRRRASSC